MLNLVLDALSLLLIGCGLVFFLAGSVGPLRFPDVYTRLHALTKADNVGLGFIIAGLMIQAQDWLMVIKLAMVEVLVLVASATVCHIIARSAHNKAVRPWEG